ncbi:MAG: DUF1653 domain-containing protein [Lachnospiraceae bacterium]|nr:DUF1653 domain-containing protein [Lachnospiraceae bacterium]
MTERNIPKPGQRYRHFKDRLYQIVTLALDSETGEKMVVYQALYGDFEIYVRPLSLFLSETNLEKYPDATQKYCFEEASPPLSSTVSEDAHTPQEVTEEPLPDGIHPKLMEFLDADTDTERYKILTDMVNIVNDHMIDTMAVVSDIVIEDGPIDVRYQELKNCLKTRMKYETNRFR